MASEHKVGQGKVGPEPQLGWADSGAGAGHRLVLHSNVARTRTWLPLLQVSLLFCSWLQSAASNFNQPTETAAKQGADQSAQPH